MQELSIPSQSASTYTPVGGGNMPTAPSLGTPVPGTTGGLPALSGLSVNNNPLPQSLQGNPQQVAQQMQQYGRGEDTMLVHMTPEEVNSLQGLAMASGGSLTINPHTGLPEAGWLGKLLPTLLGGALTFIPGIGPLAAAGIVGAGQTAITGDLRKGLMAGLGAYGGASLAGAIAPTAAGGAAGKLVAQNAAEKAVVGDLTKQLGAAGINTGVKNAAGVTLEKALQNQVTNSGLLSRFGAEAAMGTKGLLAKGLPMVAGSAVLGAVSDATQPNFPKYTGEEQSKTKYEGPYGFAPRRIDPRFEGTEEGEITFFDEVNPLGYMTAAGERRYADGGKTEGPEKPKMSLEDWNKQWDIDAPITQQWAKIVDSEDWKRGTLSPEAQAEFNRLNPLVEAISQRRRLGYEQIPAAAPAAPTGGLGATPQAKVLDTVTDTTKKTPTEDKVSVTDTLKTTIDPKMGGVTAGTGTGTTLTDRPDIPGATYDSPGVQVLKDKYIPQFTQKEDFVTKANPAYTLGTEMEALLPSLTARYSTSPGAVTAMNGYSGGSPSERIRADIRARAAARAAAAAAAGTGTTAGATTTPATTATTGSISPGAGPLDFSAAANLYASQAAGQNAPKTDLNSNAPIGADMGGEMGFGFAPSAGALAPAGTSNAANPAALIGTDAFWQALAAAQAQGQGGGAPGNFIDQQYMQEYAEGGPVDMADGSFVVDARTVSELGNGSSNAGMELLQRLGGRPLHGPGDGVSDSIPARIGGTQKARVARDEVIMPPEAVRRIGKGSEKRGTEKLYALMDKAHKARKKAKRGQDTKVAKGLGALA